MPILICRYRDADKETLFECITELQAHVASLDNLNRARARVDFDGRHYVRILLLKVRTQDGAVFLAKDGGKTVGCIVGVIPAESDEHLLEVYTSKDGVILELYVDPAYRRRRVGYALMRAIESYFHEAGCVACHVDCFAPNTPAHEFYVNLGYADRNIQLLKCLS